MHGYLRSALLARAIECQWGGEVIARSINVDKHRHAFEIADGIGAISRGGEREEVLREADKEDEGCG